jgi:hypothetical protein
MPNPNFSRAALDDASIAARRAARMNAIADELGKLAAVASELGEPTLARLIAGAVREARHQPPLPRAASEKREPPQFA